jgi:hypothetical protein
MSSDELRSVGKLNTNHMAAHFWKRAANGIIKSE